jgi:hypothetical protein
MLYKGKEYEFVLLKNFQEYLEGSYDNEWHLATEYRYCTPISQLTDREDWETEHEQYFIPDRNGFVEGLFIKYTIGSNDQHERVYDTEYMTRYGVRAIDYDEEYIYYIVSFEQSEEA